MFRQSHKQHANHVALIIQKGFVGGEIPLIDDEGSAHVGFFAQEAGDYGIGLAIGIHGRNIRFNCAASVGSDYRRGHADHVAFGIHALEEGAGGSRGFGHVIHEGSGNIRFVVFGNRLGANLDGWQVNFSGLLGKLVDCLPRDRAFHLLESTHLRQR